MISISDQIEEALRSADLQPAPQRKETVRAVVFAKAAFLQGLLDAGKSDAKIAEVFSRVFGRAVKPSTLRAYLREASKSKKSGGGKGRGSLPMSRVPKGPARLLPVFPAAAPERIGERPNSVNHTLFASIPPALSDSSASLDLLGSDERMALPSATPSAPR